MLECPDYTVHQHLKLGRRKFKESYTCFYINSQSRHKRKSAHTREASQVDSSEKFEETDTVFREFREVLIDHIERWFKNGLQYRNHLRSQ